MRWFRINFLQINAAKTQAIVTGPSSYQYEFFLNDSNVHTKDTLKILGVVIDSKLTFKAYIKEQLSKAYAKASALRRIRKFISKDVLVRLYKAYVLPHLEYCIHSPLLLGVGNAETTKIETTNYFILRTILANSKSVSYDFLLKMADIKPLEKRRQFLCDTDACTTRGHLISVNFLILSLYRTTYVGLAQGWIYLPLIWSLCIDPLHF